MRLTLKIKSQNYHDYVYVEGTDNTLIDLSQRVSKLDGVEVAGFYNDPVPPDPVQVKFYVFFDEVLEQYFMKMHKHPSGDEIFMGEYDTPDEAQQAIERGQASQKWIKTYENEI